MAFQILEFLPFICHKFTSLGKIILPGEVVTDLDPSKQMNIANSVLREIEKFIDFGLSSFNAADKPNSAFAPSTRAESLNRTRGGRLKGDWLACSHGFVRVSETKAYSNLIQNSKLETRQVLEQEKILAENIPLTRQPDFVTPLPDNPQTRSTEISKNPQKKA